MPHLVNLAMRNRQLAPYRERNIRLAEGRVLEIGVGSGLNLPLYTDRATEIVGSRPFFHGSVKGLDLARQQVATTAGHIGYDYLIIALGAELAPEAVPGMKEGAETFYTSEGAARLRHVLARFSGGRVAVVVAAMPYKCPGAP